ncbi:MAG: histidinol-phosphatase [Thermodesulfobacteriota bacterium]
MSSPVIDSKSDGHVHTRYCGHAQGEMEEYVRAAIGMGLREIVFLEHLECGISYFESTWLTDDDFDAYHREGERLRRLYGERIRIGLGVEVGFNPEAVPEILARLSRHAWDRIGVSYHYYGIDGRHYNVVSRRQQNLEALASHGIERVSTGYLAGLLAAVRQLPATVVCHLDAVLRHLPGFSLAAAQGGQISELLQAMRQKGVALEVNTSGFSHRGEPYPRREVIREAVSLGIPLVAGSDAHRPSEVGRHFDQLAGLLS